MSLVVAISREGMLYYHHLHDLVEAVNSHTLFQSLTVLGYDSVYGWLVKFNFKTVHFFFSFFLSFFLENCATLFWFLKPLTVLGPIGFLFRIGVM